MDSFFSNLPALQGWNLWIGAFVIFGFLAFIYLRYFFVSGDKRAAMEEKKNGNAIILLTRSVRSLESKVCQMEGEIDLLRRSNNYLSAGITALTMHADWMRDRIILLDPRAQIATGAEVLARVRRNINAMNSMMESGTENNPHAHSHPSSSGLSSKSNRQSARNEADSNSNSDSDQLVLTSDFDSNPSGGVSSDPDF